MPTHFYTSKACGKGNEECRRVHFAAAKTRCKFVKVHGNDGLEFVPSNKCKTCTWFARDYFHWVYFWKLFNCPTANRKLCATATQHARIVHHRGTQWKWRQRWHWEGKKWPTRKWIENIFLPFFFCLLFASILGFRFRREKWPFWIVLFRVIEPREEDESSEKEQKNRVAFYTLSAKYTKKRKTLPSPSYNNDDSIESDIERDRDMPSSRKQFKWFFVLFVNVVVAVVDNVFSLLLSFDLLLLVFFPPFLLLCSTQPALTMAHSRASQYYLCWRICLLLFGARARAREEIRNEIILKIEKKMRPSANDRAPKQTGTPIGNTLCWLLFHFIHTLMANFSPLRKWRDANDK